MQPPPQSNLSLWQRSVQGHPLLSAPPSPLPKTAPIVIVGGGLCGATLAHALLAHDDINVVLLDARELASGASGRNAGHCRPDPSRGFTMFEKHHGDAEARAILESEGEVFRRLDAFIKEHDIACEWTPRKTYDVSLSPDFTAYSAKAEADLVGAGGTPGTERMNGPEAESATRVNGTQAAWSWDAATVNPAQLTLAIHQMCVDTGRYRAFRNTPVTEVVKEGDRWRVKTPSGDVVAEKVVWANNAYVAGICDELKGIVVPVRAQAHKLSPAPNATFAPLTPSYSLRKSLSFFYSVASRPDGSIVLGVSRGHLPHSETGHRIDDHTFHPDLAWTALSAWCELFPDGGWVPPPQAELEDLAVVVGNESGKHKGDESERLKRQDAPWPTSGTGFEYAWSGIIGCTPDLVPLVGDRVGFDGQYLAVGYNGHGMARIFLTAPALAAYILTGKWDPAMPACFRTSEERMRRLREGVDSGSLAAT